MSELLALTFLGTLLAITLSLICSLFLRSDARIHVIRFFYVLNAVAEIIIAFQYQTHSWMLRAYYIEVSASTAIGLSLIWVLIGDWTSNCNHGNTNKVLIARRDLIGKARFSQVAPLEDFVVADGKLRFNDLGQKYGVLSASIYSYSWFSFDNQSGRKSSVEGVSSDAVPAALASLSEGSFMGCTLTDTKQTHRTVTVVFRRDGDQWKPVGIERTSL